MQDTLHHLLVIKKIDDIDKKYFFAFLLTLQIIVSVLDYVTGPLTPFTVFYLIPIITSAFFLNRYLTAILITLATIGWLVNFRQLKAADTVGIFAFHFLSKIILFSAFAYLTAKLRYLMRELENQAAVDILSGALTRRYFYEVSNTELARSSRYQYPVSVAYIDLDNFKLVNDLLGHSMGDKILIITAAAIKANLREGDLFGRLGGDEFALLLINTDQEEMELIMHRMRENLMKAISPFKTDVTYSIGVVTYLSDKSMSIDSLLELADSAMYSVKTTTKNSIKFVSV